MAFQTMDQGPFMGGSYKDTAASSTDDSAALRNENRKFKSKIDLLEKKIRIKDQLFDDALASSTQTSCACGSHNSENRNLVSELKRRVIALKTANQEAENEI